MLTKNPKANRRPVHSNPMRHNRIARAPYNFVLLPEMVVLVEETLPRHDRYEESTHTGWFDCDLETCSPTYVRGMVTLAHLEKVRRLLEKYKCDDESHLPPEDQIKLKEERAPFYSTKPESNVEGLPRPMIPGSSLRGLIRSLIEIVGYGKMRWVNNVPKVTFRAVAASREDPLSEPYRNMIGPFSRNVLAGYWKRTEDGEWEIQPALQPKAIGLPERAAYLKVKEASIPSGAIKDFVRFNNKNYWPNWYEVSFSASSGRGRTGPYVRIEQIGDRDAKYTHVGTLVCTGNMIESLDENRRSRRRNEVIESPRRKHALVLAENPEGARLTLSKELLEDYRDSLTPFQGDELWQPGGIEPDAPVFYVADKDRVIWFGHTPNFRIPALNKKGRPATPLDFIPDEVRNGGKPDLAEAIFGWVEEEVNYSLTEQSLLKLGEEGMSEPSMGKLREIIGKKHPKKKFLELIRKRIGSEQAAKFNPAIFRHAEKDKLEGQRAGRVFFSDAEFFEEKDGVWYSTAPLAPTTLGSPKITTFQHYLVQDADAGHNPDFRQTLGHYGSRSEETEIRGHKLYWHKGAVLIPEATAEEKESQLTRIIAVKAGVKFRFRVHFENLRDYELGALAWALEPRGEAGKTYRHKLGMGKPLGMGAVAITANLCITERRDRQTGRYARLFAEGRLASGANGDDPRQFVTAFENFILKENRIALDKQRLAEVPRIRMLLAMLQWREGTDEWLDKTRYLSIQHPQHNNEYKERPVLPDPLVVSGERQPEREVNRQVAEEKQGKVARIPEGRSFGFIKPDGETGEIFFHFSQLAKGIKSVNPGQRVVFKTRKGQRGHDEAYDVRPSK